MSLSRFFQVMMRDQRATRRTRRPTISHLRFESLEQRTLLSVSPFVSSASDPPVKYEIIAPEQTNVGAAANFEVIALDASGQQARSYNGTASLAETGAATTGSLPTSLTFHHGESDFQATFTGTGTGDFHGHRNGHSEYNADRRRWSDHCRSRDDRHAASVVYSGA